MATIGSDSLLNLNMQIRNLEAGQVAEKLRPPRQEAGHLAHPLCIDRATRDIKNQPTLLKLPDVPTHDPIGAKPS